MKNLSQSYNTLKFTSIHEGIVYSSMSNNIIRISDEKETEIYEVSSKYPDILYNGALEPYEDPADYLPRNLGKAVRIA